MACGAPTIASNASSIPEVIGLDEALFDPESEADIARLLGKTLADEAFRARLRKHGLARARKFSWDKTGRQRSRRYQAREHGPQDRSRRMRLDRRPRLAFVSPLPPERTGIADYSAELLPALARHYEIVLIVDQKEGRYGSDRHGVADPRSRMAARQFRYDRSCPLSDGQFTFPRLHARLDGRRAGHGRPA